MRLHAALVLTASFGLATTAWGEDAKKDLEKFQGHWTITAAEKNGKVDAGYKGGKVTITGDKFVRKVGDTTVTGTIKVDASKKTIDASYNDGPYKGKTLQGVYVLDGDTWRITYGEPGKDRPKEVSTKANPGQINLTLKKEKS